MARPFQVEIHESQTELEKALKQAVTASDKERWQMLFWLKSEQVNSRQELATRLGQDKATITRWLRKYKDGGISELLAVKQAPGQVAIVQGENLELLQQRLQEPQGFSTYSDTESADKTPVIS